MHERDRERAAEPARPPAPVRAAAPSQPALDVGRVLALQRTAGNALTSRLLQRDGSASAPPAAAPLTRDQIEGSMEPPKPRGDKKIKADVRDIGGQKLVVAESDYVDFKAQVTAKETDPAKPGAEIKPEARVGFIQTLEQAGRIGHYTKDGSPKGTPYANVRPYIKPGTRDVQGQREKLGAEATQKGSPPFYDSYNLLDNRGQTRELTSADRLKNAFELTIDDGKGKLAKLGGVDRFRVSAAVHQPPNPPIHLAAHEWSQDWAMDLDKDSHAGQGEVPSVAAFKGELTKLGEPTGSANADARTWRAVQSREALAGLSAQELIMSLPLAREQDAVAYSVISEGLRDMNPTFRFALKVKSDSSVTGDDDIEFAVEGLRGAKKRTAKLGSGPTANSSGEFLFGMLDFFDPNDVTFATKLTITAALKGKDPGKMTIAYPFSKAKTAELKSGESVYEVTSYKFGG